MMVKFVVVVDKHQQGINRARVSRLHHFILIPLKTAFKCYLSYSHVFNISLCKLANFRTCIQTA